MVLCFLCVHLCVDFREVVLNCTVCDCGEVVAGAAMTLR